VRWDLNLSPDFPDFPSGVRADFHGEVTSSQSSLVFASEAQGLSAVKRTIGCLFLTSLPEAGLDEALETLQEVWSYWSKYPLVQPPTALSPSRFATGTVVNRVERPPMYLPVEE
jgi:hypothetical protein